MTRKDYQLIADAIARARLANNTAGHDIAVSDCAHQLAASLACDNPAFSRAKFLAACGVKGHYED